MKILTIALVTTLPCWAGAFINLTFDEPDLSGPLTPVHPGGPQIGRTDQLLHGWTLLLNGTSPDKMTYSPVGTSSTGHVTLEEYTPGTARPELGQFGLILESGPPNQVTLALKQTGTIPLDTATLGLFASHLTEVRINDQAIFMIDPNVTFYPYVDVSRFAGQTVDLEFRVIQGPFQPVGLGFDILGFQPIPEPSTWALFGIGALAVGWFCRRHR